MDYLSIKDNFDYKKLLKQWINPNDQIEAELLFWKSRDGYKISKFHELCDNKGIILTLVHIDDNDKFGIYTPICFDKNFGSKKDMKTFIFRLNKKKL